MTDVADEAQGHIDAEIEARIAKVREAAKRPPSLCEMCRRKPGVILGNGARCRYCATCLQEYQADRL